MVTQEEVLEQFGSPYTTNVVARLHRFAFVPENLIEKLAREALAEHWGNNNFVLRKYLAVHVPWAIEQGRFTVGEDQLYVTLGSFKHGTGRRCFWCSSESKSPADRPGGWSPQARRFLLPADSA
jgi:hypothetical protein